MSAWRPVRGNLRWKLLALNLPVIAAVILVIWLVIDTLAADYFTILMEQYKISPDKTHAMFLDAVHRYLIEASIAATVVAIGLSYLFTRRALRPLAEMAEVTRRLSAGDYTGRVRVATDDEIGRLGVAVNQMADDLERIERLRRQMVADIAHELRTPLTNVRGYLEGLADGVVAPDPATLGMLQEEIMRLVRLVEALNQLSRTAAEAGQLRREEVDLGALAAQAVELDRERFRAKRIEPEVAVRAGQVCLSADADKLRQVVSNLVQNAAQHTPEGGRFRIEGSANGAAVRLDFVNSGPAISLEDLPYLFERFYRAEKSRSRDSGGAGIGLAIVKELVEAHGGTVGAESGGGENRFWIAFPAT